MKESLGSFSFIYVTEAPKINKLFKCEKHRIIISEQNTAKIQSQLRIWDFELKDETQIESYLWNSPLNFQQKSCVCLCSSSQCVFGFKQKEWGNFSEIWNSAGWKSTDQSEKPTLWFWQCTETHKELDLYTRLIYLSDFLYPVHKTVEPTDLQMHRHSLEQQCELCSKTSNVRCWSISQQRECTNAGGTDRAGKCE